MILELVIGAVGVGLTASGWIAAYRARGESNAARRDANAAAERARLAEAKAAAELAKAEHAAAEHAAARSLLRAAEAEATVARAALTIERREKAVLLEKLAQRGVPVGPDLVDASILGLYPNADPDEDRRGPEGDDEGRRGGSVPDDAARDSRDPAAPRRG